MPKTKNGDIAHMQKSGKYRFELVSTGLIKRIPGLRNEISTKKIEKVREFAKARGYYMPVLLSDAHGCMTLLAGAVTYEVILEDNAAKVPAVIVSTGGEADDLMFALQSAELDETPGAIATGGAIVQLIDTYGIPRKHIAKALDKSPAWINRMESLSRKLNGSVQRMVAEGLISSRSAQEIARLPDSVQAPFAVAASNEFLCKDNVAYLVARYLNEDTVREERERIIHTPKLALPNDMRRRGRVSGDDSENARLSRAVARCMDDAVYLSRLLDRMNIDDTAIRMSDVTALSNGLADLHHKVRAFFALGKEND